MKFDIDNREHLHAYRHLCRTGTWPETFDGPPLMHLAEIQAQMAERWVSLVYEEKFFPKIIGIIEKATDAQLQTLVRQALDEVVRRGDVETMGIVLQVTGQRVTMLHNRMEHRAEIAEAELRKLKVEGFRLQKGG